MRRRRSRTVRMLVVAGASMLALTALTACTSAVAPPATRSASATASATPTRTPTPTPTATTVAFSALAVGDCLQDPAGSDELEDITYTVVSCALPHGAEVFALPSLGDGAYPGPEGTFAAADDLCTNAFTSYVGVSVYDTLLNFSDFTPSEADWNAGHRQAACVIFSTQGRLVGSVKGIGGASAQTVP